MARHPRQGFTRRHFGARSHPGSLVITGLLPSELPGPSGRTGNLYIGTDLNDAPTPRQHNRFSLTNQGASALVDVGLVGTGEALLRRGNAIAWTGRTGRALKLLHRDETVTGGISGVHPACQVDPHARRGVCIGNRLPTRSAIHHVRAGTAEIDRLIGGGGADVFVLGDSAGRYYDDNTSGAPGQNGYADITDFNPSQGDQLRLFGTPADYLLGPSPIASIPGTALFHDSNGNGTLEAGTDELIANLGTQVLTAANTLGAASFPAALNFSDVGLSAVESGFSGVVGNSAFALRFSMLDSIPAGVLMEVQASRDLGLTDPWHTIGSRSAATGWTGAAIFTTTPATAGKSSVTLTPLLTAPELPKQSFRIRISRY